MAGVVISSLHPPRRFGTSFDFSKLNFYRRTLISNTPWIFSNVETGHWESMVPSSYLVSDRCVNINFRQYCQWRHCGHCHHCEGIRLVLDCMRRDDRLHLRLRRSGYNETTKPAYLPLHYCLDHDGRCYCLFLYGFQSRIHSNWCPVSP